MLGFLVNSGPVAAEGPREATTGRCEGESASGAVACVGGPADA
jgi:hypothetical protein